MILLSLALASIGLEDPPPITFAKTTIERAFRAEAAALGDVNKDGKKDILIGDSWYEAPSWTKHEIRKAGDYGNGLASYSEAMTVWADDVNKDGWVDQIVIGFPGKACTWYENPKGKPGHWPAHVVWPSACNETPLYIDLLGDGRRVLVMGHQPEGQEHMGQISWFEPGSDPTQPWTRHSISAPSKEGQEVPGTFRFAHGLGAADLNGDGRRDVITPGGWWEQPQSQSDEPWPFHPFNFGVSCADMHTEDLNGDGLLDVICSSAHQYGIWAFLQEAPAKAGDSPTFKKVDLFPDLVSETHALHHVDLDGDGLKDLVTGKRFWSHGKNEPGSDKPAHLYWFQAKKDADGKIQYTPRLIDEDSGVGTQFTVEDYDGDGDLDLAIANKKGVFLFLMDRAKP